MELGINFFDTAIAYQGDTSEQYLGRVLQNHVKREDAVAATKFHHVVKAKKAVNNA